MSILSDAADFITGGLSGGFGTAANVALNVVGSLIGGGDDGASGQGFANSRTNQQTQEGVLKGEALSYAERLRRLGGVYDPMKYGRGQGAAQTQQTRAMERYWARYQQLAESNPYYTSYRQMGQRIDTAAGMSAKLVKDSLTEKTIHEIEGESKIRTKV